jgi:hypothetical protein
VEAEDNFDRLSYRTSTGSVTGLRQAQLPDFDRLNYQLIKN